MSIEYQYNGIDYIAVPETNGCRGCHADDKMCYRSDNKCNHRKIIWIKKETMAVKQEPKSTLALQTQTASQSALDKQVGSNHYKLAGIQPIEYIHANNLSFCEGNVVKYITRHRNKNKEEDVRKALHYCQLILKLEYGLDE